MSALPNPFQLTPNPSDLDVQIQTLVDTHGLSAVGDSLGRQYGKTRVIAATLGQRPDVVSCVSIQHPHPKPPASQPWSREVLSEIAEQLTIISEQLEHQSAHQPLLAAQTVLLSSAQSALGIAFNCIRLYQQTPDRPLG